MKFGLLLATSLALFGLGETSLVAQNKNLLENGNFDQPYLNSGYRFLDSFPGWKGTGQIEQGVGDIYNKNWGKKVVVQLDAQSNRCISQKVKLSQGCYKFSLEYAARQGWVSSSQMTVSVNGKLMENVTCPDTRINTLNFDLNVDNTGNFEFQICGTGSSNSYGMTIGKAELSYVRGSQTNPQPQYPQPQYPQPQYPSIPVQPTPSYPQVPSFPTGRINLQSDSGNFLSRCNNCGPGYYTDSASVHESNPRQSHAIWTAVKVGDKIALRSDSGNYIGRCNNCWNGKSPYSDSAFVHVNYPEQASWSQWIPEPLSNGKWALRSADSGKYLARCNNCVSYGSYSDFAFVHADSSSYSHAQWTVLTCA